MQASKEAKALAASNSSKGKKKVCSCLAAVLAIDVAFACCKVLGPASVSLTAVSVSVEMVQGQDEGEGEQPSPVRPGEYDA